MIKSHSFDIAVIGGGPAGLAAAIAASQCGKSVLLIEREARLGGILKQCIHDGFGLVKFNKKMAGPEYAQHYIDKVLTTDVEISLLTFATRLQRVGDGIMLSLVTRDGIRKVLVKKLILSTGCRERTAAQIAVHGTRPAGVYTAGTAQYYTNVLGQLPTKKCVVLGSGDIGLIMARRLTLEGAEVVGVYEVKPTPSGLYRNIAQCLTDFDIPLHTSHTVTRVFGDERLTGVEISKVDEKMQPILGTEEIIQCDSLILSVGLIPENELAESLQVPIDKLTKGPFCDQDYMTLQDDIYVCGNALHVNDLVDYVSESGEGAGVAAAMSISRPRRLAAITADKSLLYVVPQRINLNAPCNKVVAFFRSRQDMAKSVLSVTVDGIEVFSKKFVTLRPPEMERVAIDFSAYNIQDKSEIVFSVKEVNN